MDIEFVIPIKKEDLLLTEGTQYNVKKIDINEAWKHFGACKKSISEKGCESIVDNFDVLFSILYESQDISFSQLQELWDCAINPFLEDFHRFVQEALRNVSAENRNSYINTLKMVTYICTMFIRTYEEKVSHSADNLIADKKAKGSKSKSKTSKYDTWDWNNSKKNALSVFSGILQENLNNLWDPPVAEEQFVNVIANCCYKVFENPEITQAKLKPLKDCLSQVLAVLVTQYNHGLTFVPQCVQLLKNHEHSAVPLSNAVQVMVNDFNCASVLNKVLREMTEAVRDEDLQGFGKSVATFITNLSENFPQILCPCVNVLSKCLAFEPYVVRNAVLTSFTDILLKCFASDDLSNDNKKIRDTLLKCMHNHLRDQSSYVRSKVLQLWAKLAQAHLIPVDVYMPVLRTAKARLTDSSSHVVKSAIQFFIAVLKDNIYAGKFNLPELRSQLSKAKEILKNLQSKQVLPKEQIWKLLEADLAIHLNREVEKEQEETETASSEGVAIEEAMVVIAQLLQQRLFAEAFSLLKACEVQFPESLEIRVNMDRSDEVEYYIATFQKIFMNSASNFNPHLEEYEKQKLVINYLEDTIAFALLVSEAAKDIERPLFGQSSMEAVEAIEFFTTAYQFSAGDSRRVIKEMIPLIWSRTPGIKEAIIEAFKNLYVESSQTTSKGKAMQAAKRLIKLLKELDQDQKSGLEELIHSWFQNNDLDKEFIQVLWEIFSKRLPQFNEDDSVGAIIILNTISEKNPLIVSLNLQVLIDNGLLKSDNLLLIEYVCNMISKISQNKADNGKCLRLSPDHELFHVVTDKVIGKYLDTPLQGYMALCSSVVKMIFKACWNPMKISDRLLKDMYNKLLENGKEEKNDGEKETITYNEGMLTSLFHVYGETIFRKWQYIDKDVYIALRKQVNAPQNDESTLEEEFETEVQEAANDALLNSINEVCEVFLDVEDSLDCYLHKLLVKVCFGIVSSNRSTSSNLQTVAVSTLAKLMMASSSFCENNIQVLVTIIEKASFETVRANAVLGIGDLIMRFPNILDPWTNHLYGRLKDSSSVVRLHTVVVLSHLITREMIKVRGQIAELCLCLEDPEPSISVRVRSLLKILSQKGNALYNVVPDIISRLSNPEREDPVLMPAFNRILK